MINIESREKIEWFNYWIEDANQEKERILLIGDSITRQYRKTLNSILSVEGYVCDIVAMSHSIADEILEKELKYFFDMFDYSYKYIIFHLGAHHGYWIECARDSDYKLVYEKKLEFLLDMISNNCDQVVTVSGTHENEDSPNKEVAVLHNKEIDLRNCILEQISIKNKYLFLDLNLAMKKVSFRYTDWCHYERKADEYMANRIAEVILNKKKVEILNQIDSLKELNYIMDHYPYIYVYGCGKRGLSFEKYLKLTKRKFEGYIVSEQYYQGQNGVTSCSDFAQSEKDSVVIVSPGDYQIFQDLERKKIFYKSLSERLYVYIEEYINAYMEH